MTPFIVWEGHWLDWRRVRPEAKAAIQAKVLKAGDEATVAHPGPGLLISGGGF